MKQLTTLLNASVTIIFLSTLSRKSAKLLIVESMTFWNSLQKSNNEQHCSIFEQHSLFDIIRGSIMNLYKRDYIKSVPTKQEMQLYEGILCTERKDRRFGKINHRRLYPAAVRHYNSLFPNNHIELFDFQNEGNMEQLNEEFCALIHDANTNERDVLRFINHRPAYHIIAGVFKYYNFGHHDAYVFPEFALGNYIADYLLIGKSSGGYEFVFVELEHPNGRTTLKSGHEGEAFRKGTYQIYDWKAEILSLIHI